MKIVGHSEVEFGDNFHSVTVVIKDIPVGEIAGENPAKVFKYRGMEHYNDLKSKKLYH